MNILYIDTFMYILFIIITQYNLLIINKEQSIIKYDDCEQLILYATFSFFIFSIVLRLIHAFPELMFVFLLYSLGMSMGKIIRKVA
jgi:hypothetical protein